MATMPRGEPRSVPDPDGDLYEEMLAGLGSIVGPVADRWTRRPKGPATLAGATANDTLAGAGGGDRLAVAPARPRLTGAPGLPALVAGALNSVAAAPNSAAGLKWKDVQALLSRGQGASLQAVVAKPVFGFPDFSVKVTGTLEPATNRREVAVSGIKGEARGAPVELSLPTSLRVFNTPSGELRYEIRPGLRSNLKVLGRTIPVLNAEEGQYVIR